MGGWVGGWVTQARATPHAEARNQRSCGWSAVWDAPRKQQQQQQQVGAAAAAALAAAAAVGVQLWAMSSREGHHNPWVLQNAKRACSWPPRLHGGCMHACWHGSPAPEPPPLSPHLDDACIKVLPLHVAALADDLLQALVHAQGQLLEDGLAGDGRAVGAHSGCRQRRIKRVGQAGRQRRIKRVARAGPRVGQDVLGGRYR